MKTSRLLILGLLLAGNAVHAQQFTDAGWFNAQRSSPAAAPDAASLAEGPATPLVQNIIPLDGSGPPVVAEAITPDIQALARGLEDDPVRILNYVHDHIKYVLYFGGKKGAEITLLERSGNDFDQCALLVALLRAAGYNSAAYQFGWMGVPYDATDGTHNDLHHWLGLSQINTNWLSTSNYLDNLFWNIRGYPTYYSLGDNNTFLFQRVWVTLTLGSTNYYLDPAFKVSEPIAGTNLASAIGLNTNTLLNAAQGTDGGYYVSGLNESAVRGTLTGYSSNLLNYIEGSCPNSSVGEILGGRYIVPATNLTLGTRLGFTTYVWTNGGYHMPIVNWINEPTNLMSSLAISFAGTNYQCFFPQLGGQRLALTFDTNGLAQLWQDDRLLAQHSTTSADSNVVLSVDHPVGYWDFVNNVLLDDGSYDLAMTNSYQRTNAAYALSYAFEPDWGWLQARENQMDSYRQQGLPDTSRQVVCETLNIMGLTWMLESQCVGEVLASQLGVLQQHHNRLGRMAQEAGHGYYVDVYHQLAGFVQNGGMDNASFDREARDFDLSSYFGSALEHGIIEQLQNTNLVGASTVKMLQIANTNGQPVYLANSGNWSSIQSSLAYYGAAVLNQIYSKYISQGYSVLLPANGSNHVAGAGSWAGYGYVSHINYGESEVAGFSISGGYQGGYISDPTAAANTPYVGAVMQAQPGFFTAAPVSAPGLTGADPVDLADGTFQIEAADLAVGHAEPRGISLTRYYNGRRRFSNPAGMAGGWLHNYCMNLVECSAPQAGLGGTTPAQMAPVLAAAATAIGLYNDLAPNPKNWMVTALIAKWGVDQLTRNGVSVNLGRDTLQFVRQPDSRLTPPANCTWTVSKGNTYSVQQRHGNKFNFDSFGRVTNIVDQYSQGLDLAYNASNRVQTVTDWKGRYFTFTYSGSPQRLTSVSDRFERSVTYGYATAYSSQGDLTSCSDPEGKTSTYAYDTNHQITAAFDPLSRLVVSNVYDGAGHVGTQYTEGDTNKAWQIYWSGWQTVEQDPSGGRRRFFYDDKTRPSAVLDALGNLTQTFYDGQDHVVMTVSPLNETNQFIYDGNHNLLAAIDPLGYSNQFFYDGQNNLYRSVGKRGNASTFGYNTQFSLTGSTNGAEDWVTYAYNTDGALHTRTDSAGTTTYGYDSYGQLMSIAYPDNLGSEGFQNNLAGDVLSHTNARGFVTSFQLNNRREITNTIAPTNVTMAVAYDACDNLQSKTDARRFTTTSFWSPTRHLSGMVFPATAQGTPATTNIYDNRDWLLRSIQNPASSISATTLFTNDLAGRQSSVTDPVLRTTRFGYDADGRRTNTTNAAQESTLQQWNGRGELTKLTDPATHTVLRSYDSVGNQSTLTNRNGKKWQFQFDAANRLTNTITPMSRETWQIWNDRGLLFKVRDPMNQWTTNFYDARGRLTNVADVVGVRLYGFDGNNNLTSVVEAGKTNAWTFDAYDRVSSYRDSEGNLIQYHYDPNGNVTNLVYPGGRNVYYAYDSLNRLTNVTDWASHQTTIAYDLASRVTSITRPNNTVRQINYDAAGEVTNIIEKTTTGFPIAFFTLGWTNSGRVAWEFAAPLPQTNPPPTRSMQYYDDNSLKTFNSQNVTNDADGNLTWGPVTNSTLAAYTYDARNRLLALGNQQYGYDPAGNRVAITSGATVTKFVINSNAKLPQVLMRITPGVTNYYIYGQGLLYELTETASSTNMLTYHYDYRGSTVALTDGSGLPTDRIEYSAYGLTTYRAGTNDTPFLYNGRYGVMTDANGLLYMRARYYSPYICRFINPDPAGFAGGLNWYCYADGNPISKLDPFGLGAQGELTGISWLDRPLSTVGNAVSWGLDQVGSGVQAAGNWVIHNVPTHFNLSGGGGNEPTAAALPLLLMLATDGESALLRTTAAEEGLATTSGRTVLNPVNKPSSWFEYWKPQYNPQALVFDGETSTAIHEGQHVADVLAHPQLTSLANHTYFPGAGLARYWFEYRAWAAEGALSSPLTPLNSFGLNQAVNFGADVGVFVGLPAAAGYSIYQGTH